MYNKTSKRANMKLENIKLLYADDDKELRESMKNLLEDEVSELYIANNGEDAYTIYKEKQPDILLLDINMPLINGLEVVKKIRQTDHNTRIILLTAHSGVEYLLPATELKLTKYLIKPFIGDQLFDALEIAATELESFQVITCKDLKLEDDFSWNFQQQTLYCKNEEIKLTPKEKKILHILFSNLNIVITYDKLLMDVWNDYEQSNIDTLKTMIKNIRKKLPKNTIQNIYGTGFKVLS